MNCKAKQPPWVVTAACTVFSVTAELLAAASCPCSDSGNYILLLWITLQFQAVMRTFLTWSHLALMLTRKYYVST